MIDERDPMSGDAAILSVLEQARDLSSRSDELAARVNGPRTRSHFTRSRANILAPLAISGGMRVLEIGCASSAISRALAERGADVVALASTPSRAHLVRSRCRDLTNVETRVGGPSDLDPDDAFDLVVMIDPFDDLDPRDPNAAQTLLAHAGRLLTPSGRLAIAVANPLGLRFLLGHARDDEGMPWSTIDRRRTGDAAPAPSRRELAALLTAVELPAHEWHLPFPDHHTAQVILGNGLLTEADAGLLVPHLLHGASTGDRHLVCDETAAIRRFQEADLLGDLANAFVVVARAAPPADDGRRAWIFGPDYASDWQAERVLRHVDGYSIDCHDAGTRQSAWLIRDIPAHVPFTPGEDLEAALRDAIVREDVVRTHELLRSWADAVIRDADAAAVSIGDHPFAPASTEARSVDCSALDCGIDRYVMTGAGDLRATPGTWRAVGAVDADLVRLRALLLFVERLLLAGIRIPWVDGSQTPLHVVELLAAEAGVHADPDWSDRLLAAEAALASLRADRDERAAVEIRFERLRKPWRASSGVPPFPATIRDLAVATRSLEYQDKEIRALRHEVGELQDRLAPIEILAAVQERALQDILTSPTWKIAEAAKAPLRRLRVLTDPRKRGRIKVDIDQENLPPAGPVPMDEITVVRSSTRGMAGANVAIIAAYDLRNRYGLAVEHMVAAFAEAGWRTIVSYSTAVDETTISADRLMPDVLISRDHRGAGYDFFSWRVALEVCTDLWAASRIVMVNDSVIGPISPLDGLLSRIDVSRAAVLGFAESADPFPHIQSWGIAFSGDVITDRSVSDFYCQAGLDWPKESIIPRLEVPLGMWFARRGYAVEAICSPITLGGEVRNPSIFGWEGLVRAGVPFVKRELFTKPEETLDRSPRDILRAARQLASVDIDPLVRDSIASVGAADRLDG